MTIPKNTKVILLSILIDLFGFTSIIPLFPSILAFYEQNDNTFLFKKIYTSVIYFRSSILSAPELLQNINQTSSTVLNSSSISLDSILLGGFLGSWFSLLQCFSNPIYTKKFDSSKKAIITSLSGSFLSTLIWYFSNNFSYFLLARTLGGIFEGNVSISIKILGQIKDDVIKRKAMAMVGLCYSLAFVFGPLIGVKLAKYYVDFYKLPAIFSGFCCLMALFVIVLCYIDEAIEKSKFQDQKSNSQLAQQNSKLTKNLRFIYFLYLIGFSGIEFSLGFLFLQKFNFSRAKQGRIYAVLGLLMALMQGGYVRKNAGRNLAKKSSQILLISFILLSFNNPNIVYFGLFLKAVAAAGMVPSFNFMASKDGYDLAELRSMGALARAIGPLLFCSVYWILGSSFCFNLGSLNMMVCSCLLKRYCDHVGKEKVA